MNHSCESNCATQKWIVKGRFRVGIFSTKFIAKGEELTFDYQFQRYGQEAQPCYCGTAKCRGFIGGEKAAELPEFEDLGIDEDSDEEDERKPKSTKKPKEGKRSLETKDDVMKVIRILTRLGDTRPAKIRKLLDRLEATTSVSIWRDFLRFRGMFQLKMMLMDPDDFARCSQVLRILKQIPIVSRNSTSLVESQIEEVVQSFSQNSDDVLRQQATDILQAWQSLEVVYKIPKRVQTDAVPDETASVNTPTTETHVPKRTLEGAFGVKIEDETDSKRARGEIDTPWANVVREGPARTSSRAEVRERDSDTGDRRDSHRADRSEQRDKDREPEKSVPESRPSSQEVVPTEPVPGCPGWFRSMDPNSFSFYFYNEHTHEVLWEPPAGALYEPAFPPEASADGLGERLDFAREVPLAAQSPRDRHSTPDRKRHSSSNEQKRRLLLSNVSGNKHTSGIQNINLPKQIVCTVGLTVLEQVEIRDGQGAIQVSRT